MTIEAGDTRENRDHGRLLEAKALHCKLQRRENT